MNDAIDRMLGGFAESRLSGTEGAPAGRCPSPEELAGYFAAALPEEEAERIERHLLSCADCYRLSLELAPLARAGGVADLALSVVLAVRRGALEVLEDLGRLSRPAEPAAVPAFRGESVGASRILVAMPTGEGDAEITVGASPDGGWELSLHAPEGAAGRRRASLFDGGGRKLASAQLQDGRASFRCGGPGRYRIGLSLGGRSLGEVWIEIRGEGEGL